MIKYKYSDWKVKAAGEDSHATMTGEVWIGKWHQSCPGVMSYKEWMSPDREKIKEAVLSNMKDLLKFLAEEKLATLKTKP